PWSGASFQYSGSSADWGQFSHLNPMQKRLAADARRYTRTKNRSSDASADLEFSAFICIYLRFNELFFGEPRCGVLDRIDDLLITRAAAQIAANRFADLCVGRLRNRLQQRMRRDQHARRAVTALQRVFIAKTVLQYAGRAVGVGETFDGGHLVAVGLHREHEA